MRNMWEEKKEILEKMEEELKGLIQCPVCLMAPRERGPVPICSNGHIVCQTMSAAPAETESGRRPGRRWPSAPPAWSTWATPPPWSPPGWSRRSSGEKLLNLPQLESHKEACLFRKVLCPGKRFSCNLEMPFNNVKEHVKVCSDTGQVIHNNNSTLTYILSRKTIRNNHGLVNWQTKIIAAHDKTFYLKHKKEKSNHMLETIMPGS